MNRFALGFVLLTTACGGGKSSGSSTSICDGPSAPAICSTACDPASGTGDATCGAGFHCASTGKCDAMCSASGGECGAGYICSTDGFCNADDGSGGGDDDSPPVDADCPALQFTATKVTPSIELLIDRSGSMRDDFGGGKSKFQAVHDALVGTTGVVTALQSSVYFGATLYSDDGGNTCPTLKVVPTGRAKNNKDAIATLIEANAPLKSGRTPTPPSIDAVVADFNPTTGLHKPPADSPPIIVLATDGLPNKCGSQTDTSAQSVTSAKAAYAAGLKMYILSVGTIAGAADHLQAMANAGLGVQPGQPNATVFIGNNPDELAAAFQAIIGSAVSCDLKLDGMVQADYAATGVVTLNGTALTYTTDWNLDADGTTIHLVGTACDTLKTSANPTLSATFACGSGVIF